MSVTSDYMIYVPREQNKRADALATAARTERSSILCNIANKWINARNIVAVNAGFDGGCKDGETGAGWWVDITIGDEGCGKSGWINIANGRWYGAHGTVNKAELMACHKVILCIAIVACMKVAQRNERSIGNIDIGKLTQCYTTNDFAMYTQS